MAEVTWSDVVRSALPKEAKAFRVEVSTLELTQLTQGYLEAWTIWVEATFIGVLARGPGAWLWSTREVQITAGREDAFELVLGDLRDVLDVCNRIRFNPGKTPAHH